MDAEKQDISLQATSWDQTEGRFAYGRARANTWANKLSVEVNGIQRVTESERSKDPTPVWSACTFWFSANFSVATLSVGMVGPLFGLNFWNSFAIIMIVNPLTILLPAWTATFGLTGLRMLTFWYVNRSNCRCPG